VLQFIPTSIIIWIGTIVALAVGQYCRQSNSVHFAHLWITIFKFIVTTISILCCLRFYSRNKPKLRQHNILLKLFTFKSIIGLNVAQTVRISLPLYCCERNWLFLLELVVDQGCKLTKYSSSSTSSRATAPSPLTNT
jgi:hypothetical protein